MAALALLMTGVLLSGCTSNTDEATPSSPPSPSATTTADCERLVPETILDTLGWEISGLTQLDAGRCTLSGSGGDVRLMRRAVPAPSTELPAAVQKAYTEQCAELDTVPDPDVPDEDPAPGKQVDWLDDQPTCVAVSEAGLGNNTLLTMPDERTLVKISISVLEPTDPQRVRQALTELAERYEP